MKSLFSLLMVVVGAVWHTVTCHTCRHYLYDTLCAYAMVAWAVIYMGFGIFVWADPTMKLMGLIVGCAIIICALRFHYLARKEKEMTKARRRRPKGMVAFEEMGTALVAAITTMPRPRGVDLPPRREDPIDKIIRESQAFAEKRRKGGGGDGGMVS